MNPARFMRAYPPQEPAAGQKALLFPLVKGRELVVDSGTEDAIRLLTGTVGEPLPLAETGEGALYLGDLNGVPCLAYPADETAVADGDNRTVSLRSLFGLLPEDEYGIAGYAAQLLHWQEISGYCSRCGGKTGPTPNAWAKTCTVCDYVVYPVVSPAVLILVHDGGRRILLSHKPGWGKRYSILAGFVEPGETLEECVARETLEEVGLSVTDVVYHGSQPWPYPHQIMLGFTALCPEPEKPLTIDANELDAAEWFDADALPELPGKLSLSRQLIDSWLAGFDISRGGEADAIH